MCAAVRDVNEVGAEQKRVPGEMYQGIENEKGYGDNADSLHELDKRRRVPTEYRSFDEFSWNEGIKA